jgi:1,4-dihydroxy-2-naphthoate octaprenyltransferase
MSPIFLPPYSCYKTAMSGPNAPSTPRKWLVAVRPWSFPASTMPVAFGTALAVVMGEARFSPLRFLWAIATMVLLHAAANILSDVFDFRHGLDREVTPVSGAVVRGWLTDVQAMRRAAPRAPLDFIILDGATASHNLVFGLLSTAAVILEGILRWG